MVTFVNCSNGLFENYVDRKKEEKKRRMLLRVKSIFFRQNINKYKNIDTSRIFGNGQRKFWTYIDTDQHFFVSQFHIQNPSLSPHLGLFFSPIPTFFLIIHIGIL